MAIPALNRSFVRRAAAGIGLAALTLALPHLAQAQDKDRLRGLIEPISAKTPFKMGVTLVHLKDDFWKGIAYGIVDEAKRSNVEIVQVSVAGAYGKVREQFAQLNTLRTRRADVIVIGPAAYDGYNPILKQLKDAGITVVAAGIPINSAQVDFGVAQDDRAIGVAQQKAVCAAKGSGDASVLMIAGPAGAEWAKQRLDAFRASATKDCPGLKVIQGALGDSLSLERGVTEASDMMLKNPKATFIETPAVSLGMGAAQAVRQQQRKDVKVVTSAVVREVIPMIEDGRMLAVASEPGIIMGRLIVQYAIRQQEQLPMPGLDKSTGTAYPAFMVPTVMVTQKNVANYPFDLYELPPKDWSIKALQ